MKRTLVDTGQTTYPVVVHDELLEVGQLPELLFADGGRCVLITDDLVADLHLEQVQERLSAHGLEAHPLIIEAGETSKTPEELVRLAREMVSLGARRTTPVLSLGGGVVGDLAGLVASVYMRGVPLFHLPTTLLAQVDSSIGGKTGVNLPEGKNLLGSFWQPEGVWAWIGFLETLTPKQIRDGLSESLKYGYILNPEILDLVCSIDPEKPMDKRERLVDLVHLCVEAKAYVVQQDVSEKGLRQILNFGHTIGHAVETVCAYEDMTHGEAVAIGMVIETRFAETLGLAQTGLAADVESRLASIGLPTSIPSGLSHDQLLEAALRDKKRKNDYLCLALCTAPGETLIYEVEPAKFIKILHSIG